MNKNDFNNISVNLIGSGNLATHIGITLNNNGLKINYVWSRNLENAKILAEKIKTTYTNNFIELYNNKAIYLICVPDSEIKSIAKKINSKNSILIHTSASTNISVLEKFSTNCGVFYPLQTFSKNSKLVNFKNLPVFIEYSNNNVKNILKYLCDIINAKLLEANSEQRLFIHIAAIFANNFTNHILSISQVIAKQNNIDFTLLRPIISKTFEKLKTANPKELQTGPAIRNDLDTINKHLKSLSNNPDFAKIYSFVSESIIKMYKEEK